MARFGLTRLAQNGHVRAARRDAESADHDLLRSRVHRKTPQYGTGPRRPSTRKNGLTSRPRKTWFDGMMDRAHVVDFAIELPFTFRDPGFNQIQFVALSADALESGDVNSPN